MKSRVREQLQDRRPPGDARQGPGLETLESRLYLNLFTNPSFETGAMSPWTAYAGTPTISTAYAHTGTYSVMEDGTDDLQTVATTTVGQRYAFRSWIRITADDGVGGERLRIQVKDASNVTQGWVTDIVQSTAGSNWFLVAAQFTATSTTSTIRIGLGNGGDRTMVVYLDDMDLFTISSPNAAPVIDTATVTPTSITSLGTTQNFSFTAHDDDGAVMRAFWDFGDGKRVFDAAAWSGSRTVTTTGTHAAWLTVSDEQGAIARQKVVYSVTDAARPGLTVTGGDPGTEQLVTSATYNMAGTASGTGIAVKVSTDRGTAKNATGTTSWTAALTLMPGLNRIIAQVTDSSGNITTVDRLVRYTPSAALSLTGISESASSVERWNMVESTFTLNNSGATNPDLPYTATPVGALDQLSGEGCTVNGVYWLTSNPGVTYTRPAFPYQNYDWQYKSSKDWFMPTGSVTWKLRFSPPAQGAWSYRIDVTEAKGTVSSSTRTFTATAPTGSNHGPIIQSPDRRYFQYADGTPFLGQGFDLEWFSGGGCDQPLTDAISKFTTMSGNETLIRMWLAGNLWGAAWGPWTGAMQPAGNPPHQNVFPNKGYGEGTQALRASYDTVSSTPILSQGSDWGNTPPLKQNTNYRIRIRWMIEDSSSGPANGSYPWGATVKFTDPVDGGGNPITIGQPAIIAHEHGNQPWHISEADFNSGTNDFIPSNYIDIIAENVTSGFDMYVDGVELWELDGSGNPVGSQILRGSETNYIQTYDLQSAWQYDHMFQSLQDNGIAVKLTVWEKNENQITRLTPGGLPNDLGGSYLAAPGNAAHLYHEYYWRSLFARFGAFRSIFSWELCNEGSPTDVNFWRQASELSSVAAADGNPHLGSLSSWSIYSSGTRTSWQNNYTNSLYSSIGLVDVHIYTPGSAWLTPEDFYGNDIAAFMDAYARDMLARPFTKPVVMGEWGIGIQPGDPGNGENGLLEQDTGGVWLHKSIWGNISVEHLYPMYWYEENTFELNLHDHFGDYNRFMAGIPLNNTRYVDAAATSDNPTNLRVLGQKDLTAGVAHVWLDNKNHTWRNVVNGVQINPISGNVSINMGQPNEEVELTWYDSYTGLVVGSPTYVTANGSGVVTFPSGSFTTDKAVKLEVQASGGNTPPVAVNDSYNATEDTQLVVPVTGVLTNDTDAELDPLTAANASDPPHGSVSLNANGGFTYNPDLNWNGPDSFTYQAYDGTAYSNTATVSISVAAVNDVPLADNDGTYNGTEDTPLVVNAATGVLVGDTDVDGPSALTAVNASNPPKGSVTLNADGSFTYTPDLNTNGVDTFTYQAYDGAGYSTAATVTVNMAAVNDAPVADNDSYTATQDTPLVISAPGVLDGDTDVEGSGLTAANASNPPHGSVTLNSNGGFTYTPDGGYSGPDSFTYQAYDGSLYSTAATVSITVDPAAQEAFLESGGTVTMEAEHWDGNSMRTDPSSLVWATATAHAGYVHDGYITTSSGSNATWANGCETSYRVDFTTTGTYTIWVRRWATGKNYNGVYGGIDGTQSSLTDNQNNNYNTWVWKSLGTISVGTAGIKNVQIRRQEATYSADRLYLTNGTDTPSGNGPAESPRGGGGNTPPVADNDGPYSATEDTPLVVNAATGVLVGDTDTDGPSALTAVNASDPAHGSVTLNTDGSFTYTPDLNWNGTGDTFTYQAYDGADYSNTATVTINVAAVNDAPVADNDGTYNGTEDTPLVVNAATGVLIGDTDVDGPSMTAVNASNPPKGSVTLNTDGSFTYTPDLNTNGTDTFTYQAYDGTAYSNTATVTVNIAAVNDAPVAVNDSYSATQDTDLVVPAAGVLTNDTDPDSSMTAVNASNPPHGSVTLNTNGGFTYTPDAGYTGADSFTYQAYDGSLYSTAATVSITVNAAGGGYFIESGGVVCMEAEHYDGNISHSDPAGKLWAIATANAGYGHDGYVGTTDTGAANGTWTASCETSYRVNFSTTGTYTMYVRRWAIDGNGNAVFTGIDDVKSSIHDNDPANYGVWWWHTVGTISVSTTGIKNVELRREEDGYCVDRLYVTTGAAPPDPWAVGPAESSRGGEGPEGESLLVALNDIQVLGPSAAPQAQAEIRPNDLPSINAGEVSAAAPAKAESAAQPVAQDHQLRTVAMPRAKAAGDTNWEEPLPDPLS